MLTPAEKSNAYSAAHTVPYPLLIQRGQGAYVYDAENRAYLDMASGVAVTNFGHQHPRLLHALLAQAQKIAIVPRLFHNEPLSLLLERACLLFHMDKAIPMNSGAEAVETAIKTARKWGYVVKGIPENHVELIVCNDNFHGRTITTISASSTPKYKDHFGPLTPGFKSIPFNDVEALEKAISPHTAAFLVEPIQGEAGVVLPSDHYLKSCEQLCKKHNVLFILDEIQTGMGRTGKLLASHYEPVEPDGIVLGKALGGGLLPISLFLAKNHLMNVLQPGEHGSTFGGNPLASFVAYEALNTLVDEQLVENSAHLGQYFLDQLKQIKTPLLRHVRGKGLFIAMDINTDRITSRLVFERLVQNGLLSIDTRNQAIRLLPPLVVTKTDIDKAVNIIERSLKA